jgi:threonine/homoserine/homoserine lactone efflux protein
MKALRWVAACFLLLVLMIGIGFVVAFVLDATSTIGIVVGASIAVLAWHGLRSIEPRHAEDRPPDGWPIAVLGVAAYVAVLLSALWNPWLLVFALLVFPLWWRLTGRP